MSPSPRRSSISNALLPSWAWPGVSLRATGRPLASTRAWILVVNPPRERPMHRGSGSSPTAVFGPLFCVRTMLVNADRGTVDHLEVALVSGRNCFVNSVPDAQFPPPHEAVVAGRRRTIALRYVGPGRSRAQAPENPVQHLAIIHPWLAARLVRQQRLNDRPFKISDLVAASAHHISSFEELESHHPEPRYQFMSLRPRADHAKSGSRSDSIWCGAPGMALMLEVEVLCEP